MSIDRASRLFLAAIVSFVVLPASAADRVRAGEWETTLILAGRSVTKSVCITQADADALNGDAKSMRAYVDKVNVGTNCKVDDIKINGNQVTVTSTCGDGKQRVGTTTYHGDSSESVTSNGLKSQSKWIGPCK
ncbi:MAG TPA: DUF3617 family protein [Burkholderiaceae bacterium]|nr:DUF3617 family protein [Burkholderiaceae bacterium]